jgi:hypothetical protein
MSTMGPSRSVSSAPTSHASSGSGHRN